MRFVPKSVSLKREGGEVVEIPVDVTEVDASEAPVFGMIAQRAGIRGKDTEPIWTVVFTGSDGEVKVSRDTLSRFNAFAATRFASDLAWNGVEITRFEVKVFSQGGSN